MESDPRFNCAVDAAMSVIEGRWKSTIICLLAQSKEMRFNELLRKIDGVSSRILSKQLKELEADGMILRREYGESARRVSYSLTEKGSSLLPILSDLARWGRENMFSNRVNIDTA